MAGLGLPAGTSRLFDVKLGRGKKHQTCKKRYKTVSRSWIEKCWRTRMKQIWDGTNARWPDWREKCWCQFLSHQTRLKLGRADNSLFVSFQIESQKMSTFFVSLCCRAVKLNWTFEKVELWGCALCAVCTVCTVCTMGVCSSSPNSQFALGEIFCKVDAEEN